MCSGRVDLAFVLRAFSKGADGVFIGACHLGECNYITHGNYHTLNMVLLGEKDTGTHRAQSGKVTDDHLCPALKQTFSPKVVNDFVKKVKELGRLGKSEGIDEKGLKLKLETVTELIPYIRLVERERLRAPVMSEEEYYKFFASDELNRLFKETITDKLAISQIVALLRERPLSTAEIAKILGLTPSEVSKYLNSSSRQRLVRYDESEKRYALA